MIKIREAQQIDLESIREVCLQAFPEGEQQLVAALAVNLLDEETEPETFALVADVDGGVVGHVAFSPVAIGRPNWTGYILAPLAIKPDYQNRGLGSKLIETGIERLTARGVNVLFVYGDPEFYGKFGFTVETASQYQPPYDLQYPFGWQAMVLNETDCSPAAIECVSALRDPQLW